MTKTCLLPPQVHPWDVDLTFSTDAFGNGSEPFETRVLDAHPSLRAEYLTRLQEVPCRAKTLFVTNPPTYDPIVPLI